ncbi:MAG: J domain-containing protein [gamma proteobacterium symbiont of Taylorina sp.]|nr:J domain-containing protein [gamma proteobacterium symbiont of Taylorina sp.]
MDEVHKVANPLFSFGGVPEDKREKRMTGQFFRDWWACNNSDTNKRIITGILGYNLQSMLLLGIEQEACHKLLGIASTSSKLEINRAFKKLASQHHPDKGGDHAMMQQINQARQDALQIAV